VSDGPGGHDLRLSEDLPPASPTGADVPSPSALFVATRRMGAALHRVLPWVLALGVLVAGLLATDTPAADIARYGGYWLFALLVPGTLVHRALRGSRGNLPEDVGYGAVTGLVLELAAWALAAAIGRQHLLWAWPIPVVAAFVAVPRLRRHWRIRERRPLPLRWSWGIAGVMVLVVAWATAQWSALPLPPVTHTYYVDLFYHLALVHELTRTMPFEVPQMAGEALRYHYLSHAHMATASMISGVAPTTVLLRLWLVPIVLAAALVIAALARDLSGRWWAGPLAALAAFFAYPLMLGSLPAPAGSSISLNSPSATYLVPLLAVLTALCCDLVRGGRAAAGHARAARHHPSGCVVGGRRVGSRPQRHARRLPPLRRRRGGHPEPAVAEHRPTIPALRADRRSR
jgi:hypothetical protein